jgi:hypothetical protein
MSTVLLAVKNCMGTVLNLFRDISDCLEAIRQKRKLISPSTPTLISRSFYRGQTDFYVAQGNGYRNRIREARLVERNGSYARAKRQHWRRSRGLFAAGIRWPVRNHKTISFPATAGIQRAQGAPSSLGPDFRQERDKRAGAQKGRHPSRAAAFSGQGDDRSASGASSG